MVGENHETDARNGIVLRVEEEEEETEEEEEEVKEVEEE